MELCFLIIIFLSIGTTAFLFQEAFQTRVQADARLEQKSLIERQTSLLFFDDIFVRNPFTGVRPGVYTVALTRVLPDQPMWFYQPLHNMYVLFVSEMGIMGVMGGLWFFTKLRQKYKKKKSDKRYD